jgi:hypothetical protein
MPKEIRMAKQMSAPAAPKDAEATQNRPVHELRHRNIKATIWRNMVDLGNNSRPMYNVTISRAFKKGEEWNDSRSFGHTDLLIVAKLASDAHSWISAMQTRERAAAQAGAETPTTARRSAGSKR